MAVRQVRLRRGTTAENDAFTGAIGEITVDTQTNSIRVHDGLTAGGTDLMRTDMSNNEVISTDINFTNADRTIGGAMTTNGGNPTVLTLGGAGSQVTVAGNLVVTGTTTQTDSLLVSDRLIALANGADDDPQNTNDVGILFTRTLDGGGGAQDPALFFWDADSDVFKIGTNNVNTEALDLDGAGFAYATLNLASLNVDTGAITGVTDIALQTISSTGNTIDVNVTTGQALGFTISEDGGATFFTVDTDNDKTIIDSTFEVNGTTSLDNAVVINESGEAVDFRVEGDTEQNLLFVDGSADSVGIGTNDPKGVIASSILTVIGDMNLDGAVTINNSEADVDFRVAGDTETNLLFVDASTDRVGIKTNAPDFDLDIEGTLGVTSTSTFANDLRVTSGASNGLTFNYGNNDANTTLVRVDRNGSFATLRWVLATSRFVSDADLQVETGALYLGAGTNATSISVLDQTALNTAGENLTISAGVGNGTGAGGSLILQTGGANAGALAPALTLSTSKLALFAGDLDHADSAWSVGATLGAATDLTLGGRVVTTNDLKIGGNTIIASDNSVSLELTGSNVEVRGDLTVTGNDILQDRAGNAETIMTFSGDANKTVTFAGNISVTTDISTETDLTVKGGDITLGKANGANTTLSVPTTDQGGAGWDLTISSGLGTNGNTDDGSLILRTGTTAVLTLDTDELATFTGDLDLTKNNPTIGASVGAGETLSLAGNVGSIVKTAGDLTVTGGDIVLGQANGANTTLSVPTTDQGGNGWDLTISSGLGTNGNTDDGSIVLKTGTTTVLTLDTDELATFTGDLDLTKNSPTIGASVGNGETLTLAGANSVVATAGDLKVTGNTIISSTDAVALELTGSDVEVRGELTVTGDVIHSSADNGDSITLTADGSQVSIAGDLKIGGNDIINSGDSNAIRLSADNTITTITATTKTQLSGDLQIDGNTILSSAGGGTEAIELSGANVTTKGNLTVQTPLVTLGTDLAGNATVKPFTRTTVNGAGYNLILQGGSSNGTGAGGSIVFRTQPTNGAGVGSQEANQAIALTIAQDKSATFAGAVSVGTNLTVTGDLTVNGTTTTIDTEQLVVNDPVILLNRNAPNADTDIGIFMERQAQDAALIYWDEGDGLFRFATTSAEASVESFGGTTTLKSIQSLGISTTTGGVTIDGGSFTIDSANSDFVLDQNGVLTSQNTASFAVTSESALLVTKGAGDGGTVALRVDSTNLDVETSDLLPLADSTYNIGTTTNRYATGYFDDLRSSTATISGAVTLQGAVTLSSATALNLTTAATNGITFRSEIADAGADGNATLLRVNVGGAGPQYKRVLWVAASDEFSVESGLNSVGDFGVGPVGNETFEVTASSGDVRTNGNITTGVDEAKEIFSSVTNLITLGGAGSVVKTTNALRVSGDDIQDSGNASAITFDGNQNTTITGTLTVTGNSISSSGAEAITLANADVTVKGDATIEGADLVLGTGASATTISVPVSAGAGQSLTISSGTGNLGNGTNDGSLFLRSGATTVLTLDTDELATFAGAIDVTTTSTLNGNVTINDSTFAIVDTNGPTDKFKVLANGNTDIQGTLDVVGNTTITTGDLTLTAGVINATANGTTSNFATVQAVAFSQSGDTLTVLSSGNATADAFIAVERGALDAHLRWNETDDVWQVRNVSDGTYDNILDEDTVLVRLQTDAAGSTALDIKQTDSKTITFRNVNEGNTETNRGLEFSRNGDAIELGFENIVQMPGTLTVLTSVTTGDITASFVRANSAFTGNALNISEDAGSATTAITLNYNQANAPVDAEDVLIVVERGTEINANITWDEGEDRWTIDNGSGTSQIIATTTASEGSRPATSAPTFNANSASVSAPTAVQNEHIYFLNNGGNAGGTLNINFALAGTTYDGYKITFVNIDASESIDVEANGGAQNIGGAASATINSGSSLTIVAYDTAWYII